MASPRAEAGLYNFILPLRAFNRAKLTLKPIVLLLEEEYVRLKIITIIITVTVTIKVSDTVTVNVIVIVAVTLTVRPGLIRSLHASN